MKKVLSILTLAALMSVTFVSCDDDEENAESGRQAAIEFCNCLDDGNTVGECEAALKDKYSKSEYTSSEFVDAFNEAGEACDISMTVYTY